MTYNTDNREEVNEDCLWKAISYLAADAEEQIQAIGPSSFNYFAVHIGAIEHETYLVGVYMAYLTLWRGLEHIKVSIDDQSTSSLLKSKLDDMFWTTVQGNTNFWTVSALRHHPNWAAIRATANNLLQEAGRIPSFPNQPIRIEDFVEAPTDPSVLDLL